ncbi:major facilitator superfamily MFS_1 [Segniliparus rotundus DSM 44985]|uniref:Major facilitator superfamily MFS_1 n=1 Tax=Segniliparus rotundus (strain ATCC BAA-972 / CDC 1076 / CIP 108378 / DSM 44985 / JCM 13578) TaxID=640132 RepID=D6ZDK9_SEGRD|nr:nitrate/nitrite transporter [Segniliparus rotundus]ADG99266.1 major facilitator superfamily MFS_1 [Segniliparus rotundus DSM 44985]
MTATLEPLAEPSAKHADILRDWDPEDEVLWEAAGKKIAARNLLWSVICEHVGFSIWSIWAVMVLFMGPEYHVNPAQKFLLTAMPTLVGAVLRVPYTLAPARFGGRNWTVVSALLLVIPTLLALWAMLAKPSFGELLLVAAFAGIGGGNFASSMANINAFYPKRRKGWALGLNAGGGNIGVPVIQLIGLLVISTLGVGHAPVMCAVYLVLIALAATGAALWMDNLPRKQEGFADLFASMRHLDAWLISLLYIGTFGSFIGYSFAFGQVLSLKFAGQGQSAAQAALHAAELTFLGPLLGSLSRPLGGLFADRIGGGKITVGVFVAMLAASGLVIAQSVAGASGVSGAPGTLGAQGSWALFFAGFILLFVLSGVGNGSVYKLIPVVFARKSTELAGKTPAEQLDWARSMSSSLMGIAGAIGALGGVGINLVLRASYGSAAHSATMAFAVFGAVYFLSAVLTYFRYVRAGH